MRLWNALTAPVRALGKILARLRRIHFSARLLHFFGLTSADSWTSRCVNYFFPRKSDCFRWLGFYPLPLKPADSQAFRRVLLADATSMPPTEPPRSIHDNSAWFRFTRDLPPHLSRRSLADSYTLFLPGGVLQDQGNVFSAAGELVRDASLPYCNHLADYYKPTTLRPRILRAKSLVGLCSGLQGLYYHWLFDVLPRIGMLRLQDLPSVHLYLRNDLSFQKQSLELLGIDSRQIVSAQDYPFATADEVIVPVHEVGPGQEVPAWTREFLRSAFLGRLTESGPPLPNRFYISRQGARWRRVENEALVMERLAKLGFVSVQLEQLRFAQQVALFQQAEAIVAPHGAGLANLIFSRPGTKVVEFQPHKVQDVFFNICRSLELNYYYLLSTTGPANPLNNQQQLHIDLTQLDQTLTLAEIA